MCWYRNQHVISDSIAINKGFQPSPDLSWLFQWAFRGIYPMISDRRKWSCRLIYFFTANILSHVLRYYGNSWINPVSSTDITALNSKGLWYPVSYQGETRLPYDMSLECRCISHRRTSNKRWITKISTNISFVGLTWLSFFRLNCPQESLIFSPNHVPLKLYIQWRLRWSYWSRVLPINGVV